MQVYNELPSTQKYVETENYSYQLKLTTSRFYWTPWMMKNFAMCQKVDTSITMLCLEYGTTLHQQCWILQSVIHIIFNHWSCMEHIRMQTTQIMNNITADCRTINIIVLSIKQRKATIGWSFKHTYIIPNKLRRFDCTSISHWA